MASPTNNLCAEFKLETGSSDLLSYKARRERSYQHIKSRWAGTLLDPYDLLEVFPCPASEITVIKRTAEAIGRIYSRTADLLRKTSNEALLQMGLTQESLNLVRQTTQIPDVVIGRLDLVKTQDDYKLLEFNADTPGLVVETFPINAAVCKELGVANPNDDGPMALGDALAKAIRSGIEYVGKTANDTANVVFTASATSERDIDIAKYLLHLPNLPAQVQKQFVPLHLLRAEPDGLYDPKGDRVDVLYRFYPLQLLLGKISKQPGGSGQPESLLNQLLSDRRLAIINPPLAYLMECKAVQSVIWGLYQAGIYFQPDEQQIIQHHFLPTYMDPVFTDERYAIKPVYGSDGDTVTIVDPTNEQFFTTDSSTYSEQTMVYQQYVDLPRVKFMTEFGYRSLRLLTSCFLIDGHATGLTLRAGESITDFSWWSVPVCEAP